MRFTGVASLVALVASVVAGQYNEEAAKVGLRCGDFAVDFEQYYTTIGDRLHVDQSSDGFYRFGVRGGGSGDGINIALVDTENPQRVIRTETVPTLQAFVRGANNYIYDVPYEVYYRGRDYYLHRTSASPGSSWIWRYEEGAYFWHTESFDKVLVAVKQPEGSTLTYSGGHLNNFDGHARWVYLKGKNGAVLNGPPSDGSDGPSGLTEGDVYQFDLGNSNAVARTADGVWSDNIFDAGSTFAGNGYGSSGAENTRWEALSPGGFNYETTDDMGGVEIFIGGSTEPIIHMASAMGEEPAAFKDISDNQVIVHNQYKDLYVKVDGNTVTVGSSTVTRDDNKDKVYADSPILSHEFDFIPAVNRAVFTFGYGDLECEPIESA